ncbi:MAG: patatin-like phospholipase family protein [Reyranella sp.]|uniref:patatin-like phospholipase family protein n=1 Tax=Reyranella sp. TaxID=1929291 RepID=UPI001AC28A13|nr:cyclic nucleotide-binding and patatin-like phospholipase domain-containing protein [Reyranella sp.]MBN9088119.1 patatin-like phospholipase family protein [Reyranella sp.]
MSIVEPDRDSARLRLRRALLLAPLFADLDTNSMAAVERELVPMTLPGGAPLFHQGEAADAVYLVTSGCLGVFRHDDEDVAEGGPALIAEITPGNIVGEMSLLSHGKRTRSVAALRDSEVWRLSQESFDILTAHHPEVLPALMRNVAARNAMGPAKRRRQPRTFALLPAGADVPAGRFSVLLEAALARLGEVQVLGQSSLIQDPDWFARCELDNAFVLYRADPGLTPWTELCLRQADCLIVVRNAGTGEPTKLPFEIETAQPGAVFHRRRELVLLHEGHDPKPGSTAGQLAGGLYGQHHHVRLDLPSDFDRLARLITGHAVGIVMAGGGARAFTHIGVIKALRASGVPVDQVGGTSMGAVVAAAIAARWSDEELVARFRRSFVAANPLGDYTLPFVSLFGGRRVSALLRSAFDDMDIEDLVLPYYCVTANLTTASADTHTTGKLWRWLRASVSLPGVLPPVNDAGQVHVDGGVIDNLPVRAMRRQRRGLTIAVDIDTGGALAAGAGVEESWSAWEFFRRLVWRREETLPIPSIVRILLRSALVSSAAHAIEDRAAADLLIVPPMKQIDLLDWTSFDRAIGVGYDATMQALDKARSLPIGARIFIG